MGVPAFSAVGTTSAAASGTSVTPALPSGIVSGMLLLGVVASANNATHSWPVGWTKQGQTNSGASWTVSWATRVATGADSAPAVTWTGSVANQGLVVSYSGSDPANPIGVIGTAGTGTTFLHTSAAITTTRDNSLAVYIDASASDSAFTSPSGWNADVDVGSAVSNTTIDLGSKTVATNGTSTGAISTVGATAAWIQLQVEILGPASLPPGAFATNGQSQIEQTFDLPAAYLAPRRASTLAIYATAGLALLTLSTPFTKTHWPNPVLAQARSVSLLTWTQSPKVPFNMVPPLNEWMVPWGPTRSSDLSITQSGNGLTATSNYAPSAATSWFNPWGAAPSSALRTWIQEVPPSPSTFPAGRQFSFPNPSQGSAAITLRTWTQSGPAVGALPVGTQFSFPNPFAGPITVTLRTWTQGYTQIIAIPVGSRSTELPPKTAARAADLSQTQGPTEARFPGSGATPVRQTNWPLPTVAREHQPRGFVQSGVQSTQIYQPPLNEWMVPWSATPATVLRTWLQTPPMASQATTPTAVSGWMVPWGATFGNDLRSWVQGVVRTVAGLPVGRQLAFPNPGTVQPSTALRTWLQTGIPVAATPFRPYDWSNPRGATRVTDLLTWVGPNVALLAPYPFQGGAQFMGRAVNPFVAVGSQSGVKSSLPVVPGTAGAPFFQTDWANPRAAQRSVDLLTRINLAITSTTYIGRQVGQFRGWLVSSVAAVGSQSGVKSALPNVPTTGTPIAGTTFPNPQLGPTKNYQLRTWTQSAFPPPAAQSYLPPLNEWLVPWGRVPATSLGTWTQPVNSIPVQATTPCATTAWMVPWTATPAISLRTWTQTPNVVSTVIVLPAGRQLDFPNPRGPARSVDLLTWRQSLRLGADAFFGLAGHPNFDWPNPRGYPFPQDLRTWTLGFQLPLATIPGTPLVNLQWPNPRGVDFPVVLRDWRFALSQSLIAQPFGQTDWPNPRGKYTPLQVWSWFYTSITPTLPFAKTDWSNPRGTASVPLSWNWFYTNIKPTLPFAKTDWPVPTGRIFPVSLRTSTAFFFGRFQPPATIRFDYPNPRGPAQQTPAWYWRLPPGFFPPPPDHPVGARATDVPRGPFWDVRLFNWIRGSYQPQPILPCATNLVAQGLPRQLLAIDERQLWGVATPRTRVVERKYPLSKTNVLLPAIDMTVEEEFITFDYSQILCQATVTSVLSFTCTVKYGSDANPSSRILSTPQIVTSPVTGLVNTAVTVLLGDMVSGVTYLLQCVVQTSDGQKLSLWTTLSCETPG